MPIGPSEGCRPAPPTRDPKALAMLRNMKFRSKLICILAVPILALVAIAGTESRTRYDDASQLQHLGRLVDMRWAADRLAAQLQLEQVTTVRALSGFPGQES